MTFSFTGRAFVPYMRDKAQHLFRFATLEREDIRVSIVDGYFPKRIFAKTARQSRAVPLFWRYGGGLQTRAVEVLSQGAVALSPETGICRDFFRTSSRGLSGNRNGERWTRSPSWGAKTLVSRILWVICFGLPPAREERFLKFCLFHVSLGLGNRSLPSPQLHTPVEQRGYQEVKAWPFTRGLMISEHESA